MQPHRVQLAVHVSLVLCVCACESDQLWHSGCCPTQFGRAMAALPGDRPGDSAPQDPSTRALQGNAASLRNDGLSDDLHGCFKIEQLPRIDGSASKKSYCCRFCKWSKSLEGSQRALHHAMACMTDSKPVKGCPVTGSEEAGQSGIPLMWRNNLRAKYNLPPRGVQDQANRRTLRRDPAVINSQASWVSEHVEGSCLIHA